jgi:hypothetical protein
MIPYDDLERALARWKARGQGGTPEASQAGDLGEEAKPRERGPMNGRSRATSELSGEIDINELVEE